MNRLQRGLLHQGLHFLLIQLAPIEMWIRKVLLKTRKCTHQHTYTHSFSLTNWKAYTFMHGFAKRAQTNTNRWHLLVHSTHYPDCFHHTHPMRQSGLLGASSNYSHLEVTSGPLCHCFICQRAEKERQRREAASRARLRVPQGNGIIQYYTDSSGKPSALQRCSASSSGHSWQAMSYNWARPLRWWQANTSVSVKRWCQHATHALWQGFPVLHCCEKRQMHRRDHHKLCLAFSKMLLRLKIWDK